MENPRTKSPFTKQQNTVEEKQVVMNNDNPIAERSLKTVSERKPWQAPIVEVLTVVSQTKAHVNAGLDISNHS